jgi:NAD(P)-dependent dehydrogenase (short-subunit alcohol dehydrogenase family)
MRRSGGVSVINMASILGQVGFALSSAYVAAKHGVLGMTKAAAWEHAADGVRVNAVGPGFIMTPLLEANLEQPAIDFLASQHACSEWADRKRWRVVAWPAMPPRSSPAPTTGGRGHLAR